MADETKNPGGAGQGGVGPHPSRSLDDLKAKLGIAQKARAAAAEEAPQRPRETTAEDFAYSLNQPIAASAPIEAILEESRLIARKQERRKWVIPVVGTALVFLAIGLLFGKIFKERGISNYEVKEAKHLLEYFNTSKGPQLSAEDASTLKVVEAHVEDTLNIIQQLDKAADDQARMQAEQALNEYLKRCKVFRDKRPVFTVEGAFPTVIYNKEVAFQAAQFISAVQNAYNETALLALEAETRDAVTALEDKGKAVQNIFVEPQEKDGEKWLKGQWLREVLKDQKRGEGKDGTEYGVIPFEGGGFWAATPSLVEVDITPIAKLKSRIYKGTIEARVRNAIGRLKAACDPVAFKPLKDKLEKIVARGEHTLAF